MFLDYNLTTYGDRVFNLKAFKQKEYESYTKSLAVICQKLCTMPA